MADTVRVAVAGAMGRMGAVACDALRHSGEFCCGLGRTADSTRSIVASLDDVVAAGANVVLDLTTQPGSFEISLAAVTRGLPTVIGASGWTTEQREALASAALAGEVGALLVPNFSLGATLAMRFAQQAAPFFPDVEIVELHHPAKKDKPSGTALETAARIARTTGRRPEIHSVRLAGLLAHQEVLFGRPGEVLTIRHDSLSRESFVAGMLVAVRSVGRLRGLSVGLDSVLGDVVTAPGAAP
jgi:4-hydroxy-tetrahydrodipicolinate reductase